MRRGVARPVLLAVTVLPLLAMVPACSPSADDGAAITPDDQRQLNEAAAMLDANSVDANAAGAHESSPHD